MFVNVKKTLIQFLLLLLLLSIVAYTFFFYFYKKENLKENKVQISKSAEPEINDETASLIKGISYSFNDPSGNSYQILSEFGKIDLDKPESIFMTNVVATIKLNDSNPVTIVSKFANYNKTNHETNFFENVELTYEEHMATSQNLDLLFKNNLISMYNNIIYKKPSTMLTADRLEIDLITKNSKIFMDSKSEKIKIINK
jgi:hypothetical protein